MASLSHFDTVDGQLNDAPGWFVDDVCVMLAPPEVCDDSNTNSADGCRGDCRLVEDNYNCFVAGFPCVECGNGVLDAGEACDEVAFQDDTGCVEGRLIQANYQCRTGEACEECGDGVRNTNEGCDDGNVLSGDGCDSVCEPEAGYDCSLEVSVRTGV